MFTSKMNKLLVNFKPRDIPTLEKYFLRLDSVPSYKKLLSTMIRFSQMYRPIGNTFRANFDADVGGINAVRSIRRAQIYMNKKDIIKTYDSREGKRLVVTSTGKKIFYRAVPLARLREQPWDGFWTVAMYDFEERSRKSARQRIRRVLSELGFGSPQRSVMVCPLPVQREIEEIIKTKEMEKEVWVMRAEGILGMQNNAVAQNSWPLDELNYFYESLIDLYPKAREDNLVQEWTQIFLAVDNQNPYLPKELLPEDWAEAACKQLFYQAGQGGVLKALFSKIFSPKD